MPAQRLQPVRSLKSCEVCRRRKTRCELPDAALDLAPSDTPLSAEFVCYRCRVLGLPCVLVASTRASYQPRSSGPSHNEGHNVTGNVSGPHLPSSSIEHIDRSSAAPFSTNSNAPAALVPTGMDSHPGLINDGREQVDIALTAFEPDLTPTGSVQSPTTSTPLHNSLIYHGRPLELTAVMIKMSYAQSGPVIVSTPSVTDSERIGEQLQSKLAEGRVSKIVHECSASADRQVSSAFDLCGVPPVIRYHARAPSYDTRDRKSDTARFRPIPRIDAGRQRS